MSASHTLQDAALVYYKRGVYPGTCEPMDQFRALLRGAVYQGLEGLPAYQLLLQQAGLDPEALIINPSTEVIHTLHQSPHNKCFTAPTESVLRMLMPLNTWQPLGCDKEALSVLLAAPSRVVQAPTRTPAPARAPARALAGTPVVDEAQVTTYLAQGAPYAGTCAYTDKDEAKSRGAQWDTASKSWFAPSLFVLETLLCMKWYPQCDKATLRTRLHNMKAVRETPDHVQQPQLEEVKAHRQQFPGCYDPTTDEWNRLFDKDKAGTLTPAEREKIHGPPTSVDEEMKL